MPRWSLGLAGKTKCRAIKQIQAKKAIARWKYDALVKLTEGQPVLHATLTFSEINVFEPMIHHMIP
jgi:hypothetical protein